MEQHPLDSRHQRAIRAAVQRYERPLVGFARRYTGDLNTARDVAQDTFLRLCQQTPEKLDELLNSLDRSRLEGWLFIVARNGAIDAQRRIGRDAQAAAKATAAPQRSPANASGAGATAPPVAAEHAELADRIIGLVDALPPKQAEAIRLRFQQGLSYRSIADLTGHTVSYVGYLIHEGLKALRAKARGAATPSAADKETKQSA